MKIWAWLLFEPRDLWVGVFWDIIKPDAMDAYTYLKIYICIIPMLPLFLKIRLGEKDWSKSQF